MTPKADGGSPETPIGYDGGINLYGYCQNDPVNEGDPNGTLGLSKEECEALLKEIELVQIEINKARLWPDKGHQKKVRQLEIEIAGLRAKYAKWCLKYCPDNLHPVPVPVFGSRPVYYGWAF